MGENKKLGPSGLQLLWAKVLSAIKNFTGEVDVSKDGNLQAQVNALKNKTNVATTSADGLMSSTDKTKLDGIATGATKVTSETVSGWGFTKNTGTVTGIKMNGISKGTSGDVDLGTVLTGGSQTTTSSADGGSNVFTFSDGSTITVKNGTKGSKGDTGETGPQGNPGTNATTTAVVSTSANGLAPKVTDTNKFLKGDGTWATPTDTTYTPQKLGIGYGTCTTAEATTAKVVTLTDYNLVTNGLVAVKFTYKVPASSTLNINGKGAKAIYRNGAAITANKILAGDTALFIYNGTQYELLATSSYGTQDSNTWTAMKGATASAAGGAGYVPAPAAGANTKFLRGDGTWQTVLPTTLSASLAANATSLVFSNSIITTSSRITVYAADATVGYTNITTVAGKTTITFPSTHNATTVYIDVLNI